MPPRRMAIDWSWPKVPYMETGWSATRRVAARPSPIYDLADTGLERWLAVDYALLGYRLNSRISQARTGQLRPAKQPTTEAAMAAMQQMQ